MMSFSTADLNVKLTKTVEMRIKETENVLYIISELNT